MGTRDSILTGHGSYRWYTLQNMDSIDGILIGDGVLIKNMLETLYSNWSCIIEIDGVLTGHGHKR